jgi:hypothetical protein
MMAPKPERLANGGLTISDDGRVVYRYHTFRFLLSDGRVLDVYAIHDDSNLRGAVLDHIRKPGVEVMIAGVTQLPEQMELQP